MSLSKLSALATALAFSSAAISATEGNYPTTNDWQSSLAVEFTKLDKSGNGLLLPLEASKGKAFNRKSFAAADVDKDGTIDQDEYINYRISKGATNQPGAATMSSDTANSSTTSSDSMNTASDSGASSVDAEMSNATTDTSNASANSASGSMADTPDKTAEMSQDTGTNKRTAGVVIEDSVITTKAKAAIFGTPDLKTLQISVETRQGEVTLTGMVDSAAAKMKAEEVVKGVEGVNSVMNNLEVKG